MKLILILFSLVFGENLICQTEGTKVETPQLNISDYHHDEHLLCDSLSVYYSAFDYSELNDAQRVFYVLGKDCDHLWEKGLLPFLQNEPDSILTNYIRAYQAIKYEALLNVVNDIRTIYELNKATFDSKELPPELNKESNLFDEAFELKMDILEADALDKQCGICTSVALDLILGYIVNNKDVLIKEN